MEGVVEKTKKLLKTLVLQKEWIRLARLYIAILETEVKVLKGVERRASCLNSTKGRRFL